MSELDEYQEAFTEERFWNKLARSAGKEVVEKALLLFYAGQQEDAPAWAKATIVASLGYFIVPLDAMRT